MTDAHVSRVASQRIADELAEKILAGAIPPGMRMKQEDIAEEFRASRIPVREALRMLEARGLVQLKANTGAWVSEMNAHDLSMTYRIREQIEPLLLSDSMARLSQSDIDEMHAVQEEIEAGPDVESFLRLDRRFHWLSYRAHVSPYLATMVERLWDTTQMYRRTFTVLTGQERVWLIRAEHRLLLDAISRRDEVIAGDLLQVHIRRTRLELERHPEIFTRVEG